MLKILSSSENPTETFTGKICAYRAYRGLLCSLTLHVISDTVSHCTSNIIVCLAELVQVCTDPVLGHCSILIPKSVFEMHWVVEQELGACLPVPCMGSPNANKTLKQQIEGLKGQIELRISVRLN